MKTISQILILVILTASIFAAYSESNTWLVSKMGNDGNPGAPTSDPVDLTTDSFLTIGAAISAASDGDTILIWPGSYSEDVNASSKKLKMVGQGPGVIIGEGLLAGSYSTYINLNVNSNTSVGISAVLQTNVRFVDVNSYGLSDSILVSGSNMTFIKCQFRSPWDAVNLSEGSDFLVKDCFFNCSGTQTGVCHAIQACANGTYENNTYKVTKTDTSASDLAGVYVGGSGVYNFKNERFIVKGGSGRTGRVCGIHINNPNAIVNLDHCTFSTSGPNANGGPLDIYVEAGTVNENGCVYTTSLGTITHGGSGWAAAVTSAVPTAAQSGEAARSALTNDPNFPKDSSIQTYFATAKTERDACDVAILAKTDLIPDSPAAIGSEMSLTSAARTQLIADACDAFGPGPWGNEASLEELAEAVRTAIINDPNFVEIIEQLFAAREDINDLKTTRGVPGGQ